MRNNTSIIRSSVLAQVILGYMIACLILISAGCGDSSLFRRIISKYNKGNYQACSGLCIEYEQKYPNSDNYEHVLCVHHYSLLSHYLINADRCWSEAQIDSAKFYYSNANYCYKWLQSANRDECGVDADLCDIYTDKHDDRYNKCDAVAENLQIMNADSKSPLLCLESYHYLRSAAPELLSNTDSINCYYSVISVKKRARDDMALGSYELAMASYQIILKYYAEYLTKDDQLLIEYISNELIQKRIEYLSQHGISTYDDKEFYLRHCGLGSTIKLLHKSLQNCSELCIRAIASKDALSGMNYNQVYLSLGEPEWIKDLATNRTYRSWKEWQLYTGGVAANPNVYVNMRFPSAMATLGFMDGKLSGSLSAERAAHAIVEEALAREQSTITHMAEEKNYKNGWTPEMESEYGITPDYYNTLYNAMVRGAK